MIPTVPIKMKTQEEILARLKELVQRSRKRYIKNHMKPKGSNCAYVIYDEELDSYRCTKCGTLDPDQCMNHELFSPKKTREEVVQEFAVDIKNPQILLRDYRAEAALLWTLGQFPEGEDE